MQLLVPFHADHALSTASADLGFAVLLALAGLGSALLVGVALAALVRRRSRSHLLVTLALATLLVRTCVGALLVIQSVDAASHHLIEHALDVVMAALVVAAVYDARRIRGSDDGGTDREPSVRSDGGVRTARARRRDAGRRADARGDDPRSVGRPRDDPRDDGLRGDGLRDDDRREIGPQDDDRRGDEP